MTDNDNDRGRVYVHQLALPDGSTWGQQEVMDLRAEFIKAKADLDEARRLLNGAEPDLVGALRQEAAQLQSKEQSLVDALEEAKARANRYGNQLVNFQNRVRDEFRALVDEGEVTIDAANAHLDELGLEKLAMEYGFTLNVSIHGTCKAIDEDELRDALTEASIDFDTAYTDVEDVEVTAVDIDDVEVERA